MVFYELNLIVRPLTKPGLVVALKKACQGVWDQNGVVIKIENLGYRDLPFTLKKFKQTYNTGNQFLLHCSMPKENTYNALKSLRSVDDIIHRYFKRVDPDEPDDWPPCTLNEELKPPAYRANIEEARKAQVLTHEVKIRMGRNIRRSSKIKPKSYTIGPWRK